MPCKKCGTVLLNYKDNMTCPPCTGLKMLDSDMSSKISSHRVAYFQKLWKDELSKIERSSLLLHITAHREHLCREFFKKYSLIELGQYFRDTLFLKRAIFLANPNGSVVINDTNQAKSIIELFETITMVETYDLLIKSCYANTIYENEFNVDSLSDKQLLENFTVVHNEKYLSLMKSYKNYGIFSPDEGEKKIKEHEEEFNNLIGKKSSEQTKTSQEFIKKNYDLVSGLYLSLLRNALYAEVFDVQDYDKIMDEPSTLMKFVNTQFLFDDRGISVCNTNEFLVKCRLWFKKDLKLLRKILLFEDENPHIFPLFVRIKNDKNDFVCISQAFTIFIYILLHAIITKKFFKMETDERARKFEITVQQKFEELGFAYKPNFKDNPKNPTLEIDGIAVLNETCYVIECKKPRLPPLVEANETRKLMIEDLKGIVDGFKRIQKDGVRTTEPRPSLPSKITYVKSNMGSLGSDMRNVKTIHGLIVTMDYPFIEEYKGIHILSLNELSSEKLK
jgi:hypothetical protein